MKILLERGNDMLQNISPSITNIITVIVVLTVALTILRASEVSFRFKDLIEVILKK